MDFSEFNTPQVNQFVESGVTDFIAEDEELIARYVYMCFGEEEYASGPSIPRQPFHTSILSGHDWVQELVHGHPQRMINALRMSKDSFHSLCYLLRDSYALVVTKKVSIYESVAIFIYMVAHGKSYRQVQERFQRGPATIQRHIYNVLDAINRMAVDFIKPDDNNPQHPKLLEVSAYFPFRNCIGALDGTHIDAVISPQLAPPYIGRKGSPTQNVLAVCDFNMRFIFVSAGWEGSMHDTRVLREVLHNPRMNFPLPATGKYYLADAGYPNMKGFLTPFKGERMHLQQFRQGDPPRNIEERFNRMHSSLRSVIERAFGCLKMRFQILRHMPSFEFEVQTKIVGATFTLHNFLRQYQPECNLFNAMADPAGDGGPSTDFVNSNIGDTDTSDVPQMRGDSYMDNVRRQICNEMEASTSS